MNQAAVQKTMFSVSEEMQSTATADRRERVVCPKPRRIGKTNTTVNNNPFRQRFDSLAANDDWDLLCFKGLDNLSSFSIHLASPPSPPFLYGSPPCRVANPLIQDPRFGDEKLLIFSPVASLSPPLSSGRVRSNYGNNPVVRIEGFDCCITALA